MKYKRNIQKHAVPEVLRLGFWESKTKATLPKVSKFAEKRQSESTFWEVLLLGWVGGGQPRVSDNIVFLFQHVSPISIVIGGHKNCLSTLLLFNVVLEAHIHEQIGFKLRFEYTAFWAFWCRLRMLDMKFKFQCVAFLDVYNHNSRITLYVTGPGSVPKNCTTESALGQTQVTWVHQTNSPDVYFLSIAERYLQSLDRSWTTPSLRLYMPVLYRPPKPYQRIP